MNSMRLSYGTYVFLIVLFGIIVANIYNFFQSYSREKVNGFKIFILVITGVFVGIIADLLMKAIIIIPVCVSK